MFLYKHLYIVNMVLKNVCAVKRDMKGSITPFKISHRMFDPFIQYLNSNKNRGKGTPKKPYYCRVNRHLRLASVLPQRDLQVSNTMQGITTEEVYL